MYKAESVLDNETRKILWDFNIQTGHPIPARSSSHVLITRKNRTPVFINKFMIILTEEK